MGRGLVFRGQPRPCPKGMTPIVSQFWGFRSFMLTPLDAERQNSTWQRIRGGACFYGVSHDPVPKGWRPSFPNFRGFGRYAHTRRRTTKFDVIPIRGGACFYGVSHVPPKERNPVPMYLRLHLWRRNIKFDMLTHMGMGLVFRGQPRARSALRGRAPSSPVFGVPLYLRLHPLTQNDQIQRGITYGEGTCF